VSSVLRPDGTLDPARLHNLDLPTSLKAKQAFERAIAINPNDRRANYLFGMFLISTKAYHFDSLPYLQKAYALGEEDALFSIGMLLVRKDEKAKGLEALEKYAKVRPESVQTRRVIEGIKNGTLTFHETANPPINAKR
jgi:tetratricopeptide (TPR) repeat protein